MINRLPSQFQAPHANGKQMHRAAPDARAPFLAKAARTIGSYPAAALGIAFTAGLIIGRWVKR
jgi:hypothetical protein